VQVDLDGDMAYRLNVDSKEIESKGLWGKKYPMMQCKGNYAYSLDDKEMQNHDL
jgi:hypothetical protein